MVIRNLFSIKDISAEVIKNLLKRARFYLSGEQSTPLFGKIVANIFFEPSLRSIVAFEIAAKKLGASVVNVHLDSKALLARGELDVDIIDNVVAAGADALVVRHSHNLFHETIRHKRTGAVPIINAGDGINEHPTQALGDLLTIMEHFGFQDFIEAEHLKIVIFGGLAHSRVTNSTLKLLDMLGIGEITVVAPPDLEPQYWSLYNRVKFTSHFQEALEGSEIVIGARFKKEYQKLSSAHGTESDYPKFYCLNKDNLKLCKPGVLVLHSGPVIRENEITSDILDFYENCRVLFQVSCGTAMKQAVLEWAITKEIDDIN